MSLIKVQNLGLSYHGHPVFEKLNFEVNRGDFLCIVGPNGCGKTTLLECLLGLIKPTTGKITFADGLDADEIGYMAQRHRIDVNFPASVYEIVSSGALGQTKLFQAYPRQRIQDALKALKISDLAKEKFGHLSGGQQQKVLLARAIVATKELLILDEPSNNLDYRSKQDFYRILRELNHDFAIIMVTHDLDHHNLIGNRILSLDHDNPFFGTTAEYVRRVHAH